MYRSLDHEVFSRMAIENVSLALRFMRQLPKDGSQSYWLISDLFCIFYNSRTSSFACIFYFCYTSSFPWEGGIQ